MIYYEENLAPLIHLRTLYGSCKLFILCSFVSVFIMYDVDSVFGVLEKYFNKDDASRPLSPYLYCIYIG